LIANAMALTPPTIECKIPWFRIEGEQQEGLAEELRREVGHSSHVLYGLETLAIAYRKELDDFLFYLGPEPPSFALVHFTWTVERNPDFPYAEVYQTWEECFERAVMPAIREYED
jgi:hypothetical protein